MKTLRKIGMAFLAVMLCVSFVACDDDDDEVGSDIDLIEGTWALQESKGIEWDYDGEQSEFHEVFDVEHPALYNERISFERSTGDEFLITGYEYGHEGWEKYDSETVHLKNIADFEAEFGMKVIKLNAKTMVLFEPADPEHFDTEEVTETYVRVK